MSHNILNHSGHNRRFRNRFREGEVEKISRKKIILVGNPNVGKSVVFGALTGRYTEVSNYPGTSVEITTGEIALGEEILHLVDSPGINSLSPRSEDEQVTLRILLREDVAGVIQIVDAKNLKRGLLLTYQLIELGFPLIVCLNMMDEAEEKGLVIDFSALEKIFGVRFIGMVAVEGRGLEELRMSLGDFRKSYFAMRFHPTVEASIAKISQMMSLPNLKSRGLALNFIASAGYLPMSSCFREAKTGDMVKKEVSSLNRRLPNPSGYEIQTAISNHIESIAPRFLKSTASKPRDWRDRLGYLTMHKWLGLPFILLVLLLLYEIVGVFGAGVCVDFIENRIFGGFDSESGYFGILNPVFIRVLKPLGHTGILGFINDCLVGEYGTITVGLKYSIAIVFPVVTLFFIFFGLLEDSGYLPRLTVLSNRSFRRIGLNGRAILPMVLGLGCDTMATFTTRILETPKERTIVTLLLALGIPCSAQLGVALGLMSAVSPGLLLVVVFTVALQLLIVGYGASKFIKGQPTPLLTEIPPLRIPKLKNIVFKTYFRVKWFMKEAVPLFVLGTFILFLLDRFKFLSWIEQITSPIITGLLQLPREATEAFIIGFLRRDYGAAGLYRLANEGLMDAIQVTVGITVMVLFVPCLANFFVIIKERGLKTALVISGFIIFYAVLVGAGLNVILRWVTI
jgi:ferrous iron transport protein B